MQQRFVEQKRWRPSQPDASRPISAHPKRLGIEDEARRAKFSRLASSEPPTCHFFRTPRQEDKGLAPDDAQAREWSRGHRIVEPAIRASDAAMHSDPPGVVLTDFAFPEAMASACYVRQRSSIPSCRHRQDAYGSIRRGGERRRGARFLAKPVDPPTICS